MSFPRCSDNAPRVPDAAELLVRLCSLVALQLAHLDHHPAAYQNPSGEILEAQVRTEARKIFRSDAEAEGPLPGESAV